MDTTFRDCAWVRERIDAYLDGETGAAEARSLEAHLDACAGCARELDLAGRCRRELRALPPFSPPRRAVEAAERAAAAGTGSAEVIRLAPRRRAWRARWVSVAAAVLAIAAVGVWRGVREPPTPVATSNVDPHEIEQASRDAALALAYVGKYTRRAETLIRDDVIGIRVVLPMHRAFVTSRAAVIDDAIVPGMKRAIDESGFGETSEPHVRS
jgi:Putative zinc-finger